LTFPARFCIRFDWLNVAGFFVSAGRGESIQQEILPSQFPGLNVYFVMMNTLQYPVIGFGLVYSNELIYSEAIMKDNHFDVLFDGNWVASMTHTDDWDWMQASGIILPEEIITEIGLTIESHYQ
jgi:hypothetical protein